jgi:hypothetical protein
MNGTGKQIAWANDIIEQFNSDIDTNIAKWAKRNEKRQNPEIAKNIRLAQYAKSLSFDNASTVIEFRSEMNTIASMTINTERALADVLRHGLKMAMTDANNLLDSI